MIYHANHDKRPALRIKNGFTIVEVLIVMAAAGIILLIVFQAIPTLLRNSRNNQRKQDVATILEAISHWELSNSGNIPAPGDMTFLQNGSKLTYYDTSGVTVTALAAGGANQTSPGQLDKVNVYNHQKCSTTSQGDSTSSGAGYNDIVALYAIETGGGATTGKCQQL